MESRASAPLAGGADVEKVMAKSAVKKVAEAEVAANPAAWLEVRGGVERAEAAPALVRLAIDAWALARRIDELEAELAERKAELAKAIGTGRSLVVPGVCRVSVAATSSVTVTDVDKLRALLGERFADLVISSVSYKPTDKLIEMSVDGDDPMAPAYGALLRVRSGTTVRITAEK